MLIENWHDVTQTMIQSMTVLGNPIFVKAHQQNPIEPSHKPSSDLLS
jgi:hypothetical protein